MNNYIEYFKKLGIVIIHDLKNIVITINLDNNFVSITNAYSTSHVCINIEPKTLEHPIALRIFNYCDWSIYHTNTRNTNTRTVIVVKEADIKISDKYTINIH